MAKGSNSIGLVRVDYLREGADENAGSTLIAIGTEKTLLAYIAANIPGFVRDGKEFRDAAGDVYCIHNDIPWILERMKSDGGKLPYTY